MFRACLRTCAQRNVLTTDRRDTFSSHGTHPQMKNKRFIPGIFNYCDYWCERCAFTQRCRNYSMSRELEREANGEEPDDDATQASFWNQLADQVRETTLFNDVDEWEDEFDSDVDELPDASVETRIDAHRQAVEKHPLVVLSHSYMLRTDAWLKDVDADLKTVAQTILDAAQNNFGDRDLEEEARQIGEIIEIVGWYHTLIPAKLSRAMGGLLHADEADEALVEILTQSRHQDANGCGKLVLVAIERSTAAWLRLRTILPSHEDEILDQLALLSRIQKGLHTALPHAHSFRRPGLDGEGAEDEDEDESKIG